MPIRPLQLITDLVRRPARATTAPPLDLPPYPLGWYVLCFSDELKPGELRTEVYFGQELVLFRTAAGKAAVVDAYCPHMGAHFAHGGEVQGETLRCPFHGFCFDTEGSCVSTPYKGKLPRSKVKSWPIVEQDGLIMTWFDEAGGPPRWEIPKLAPEDFGRWWNKTWPSLRSHPQETTENSVDLGHLQVVHGYRNLEVLEPLTTDGPYLTSRYAIDRVNPFSPSGPPIHAEFLVHVRGLGHSYVESRVEAQGLRLRHYVLPTPTRPGHIALRIAVCVSLPKPSSVSKALGLMPAAAARKLVSAMAYRGYVGDVTQDFKIWENKRYLQPPALAEGDGPVGRYRSWCRQFYAS